MRSWCFDSVATTAEGVTTYDREYGSAELREIVGKLIGNGVYATPATNMQVVADSGMAVKVQPGSCWISGAYGVVDTAESFTLDASSGGRVDLIVARFDLSIAQRSIRLAVIKGTSGSSAAPALSLTNTTYDIELAKINVRSGAASILQSDITDTRYDSTVCGQVTGVVDQIDATNLFAQYQASFDAFMETLEDVLDEDTAGNLLNLINNHKNDTTIHTSTAEKESWTGKAEVNHTHTAADVTSGVLGMARGGTGAAGSLTAIRNNLKYISIQSYQEVTIEGVSESTEHATNVYLTGNPTFILVFPVFKGANASSRFSPIYKELSVSFTTSSYDSAARKILQYDSGEDGTAGIYVTRYSDSLSIANRGCPDECAVGILIFLGGTV